MSAKTLRKNLDTAIKATGLSMSAFARAHPEVGRSTLNKFLNGTNTSIALEHVEYYAKALDTSVGILIGESQSDRDPFGYHLIPYDLIDRSDINPREVFDLDALVELANSIKERGLLQPIGLYKTGDRYTLAYGERRWRAMGILIAEGLWPSDMGIDAIVKTTANADEQLLAAIVENLQREDIPIMDEARALMALRDAGEGMSSLQIANAIGKTQRFVQKRLALVERLGADAQKALARGELSLDAAQAVARVPVDDQLDLVEECKKQGWSDAENVMREAKRGKTIVGEAIFDLTLYTGGFIGEGKARLFSDMEQFLKLQKAAAEAKVTELKTIWSWSELKETEYFHTNFYRETTDHEVGGAVVQLRPTTGEITVHEGLLKPTKTEPGDVEETAEEKEEREQYEWKEAQRGAVKLAARDAIRANPRLALVNHIFVIIGGSVAGSFIYGEADRDTDYMVIDALGLVLPLDDKGEPEEDFWDDENFMLSIYRKLCGLTSDELLHLLALATAEEFNTTRFLTFDSIDFEFLKELKVNIPDELLPTPDKEAA